jgi:hypothetical protein
MLREKIEVLLKENGYDRYDFFSRFIFDFELGVATIDEKEQTIALITDGIDENGNPERLIMNLEEFERMILNG